MKTLDEMIAVMLAAKEGKKIEYYKYYDDTDTEWKDAVIPCWNWSMYDYRVKVNKQEPIYVPYESAEEFLQAQQEHGPYLKVCSAVNLKLILPIDIDESGIQTIRGIIQYNELCEECPTFLYTWQDDTPCGKLKNE